MRKKLTDRTAFRKYLPWGVPCRRALAAVWLPIHNRCLSDSQFFLLFGYHPLAGLAFPMNNKIISLMDARHSVPPLVPAGAPVADVRGRHMRDLRISITDRCNFRCTYCMPKKVFGRDYPFLPRAEILSFDEIVRVARIFAARGVGKVRLTGGEPLLRPRPGTDADHQWLAAREKGTEPARCWSSAHHGQP